MKKSELKTLHKLKFKNGNYRLVMLNTSQGDVMVNPRTADDNEGNHRLFNQFPLYNLTEDLKDCSKYNTLTDVIKVYGEYGQLLWERKEEKFKKGEWLKWGNNFVIWNEGKDTVGIWDGEWSDWLICSKNTDKTKATPKEIEEALIKEAKKRGFKEDLKRKPIDDFCRDHTEKGNYWSYNSKKDILRINVTTIYKQSKWAEIITPNPRMTREQYQELYPLVCENWQEEMVERYSAEIALNGVVDVDQDVYERATSEATKTRVKEILNELKR